MNKVEIIINGKNVTGDVSSYLSSVSYSDHVEAYADSADLSFEDTQGKWQDKWYPAQGDTLEVKITSEAGRVLDCGLFEIDEIELSLAPDIMSVKGLATPISKALRTKNNKAFEKQTLRKIASYFADKHGFSITGNEGALQKVEIDRKTQENETDLAFLSKLAKEYGIIFNVKGKQLVFMDIDELEGRASVAALDRSNISTARFTDKTSQIYESASIARRNMRTNSVKKWNEKKSGVEGVKNDIVINKPASSEGEAKQRTEQEIRAANAQKITGSITIAGDTAIMAGVNIDIADVGQFSGKWHVISTTHSISAQAGYVTSAEVRKIVKF
jgi:phage protein D